MAYSDFLARTENGVTIQIPVDELLRILLSGQMPDGTTYAGVGIAGAAGSTYDVSDRPARDIGKVDIAAFDVALPAGTNLLGTVGVDQTAPGTTNRVDAGDEILISQTPAVTAGAYGANDAVGGLLTFADAARATGMGGVVKSLLILDDAGQDVEMELWLFRETFTAMADNAAWAPSQADLRKLVGIISTADGAWFAAGTPSAGRVEASQTYTCTGTSLFGQLVTRGTPTFAATDDISIVLGCLRH